ncbi:beta strand repeat-containing protein, partial [Succinatimonas hippei]|uniref:beta strand repeat-containing protein n=1 Tax=Succinatimonas hippei TaxID=626938 RepID=UPI0005928863
MRIDEKANGGQIELTAKSNIVYAGDAGLNNSSKNEEAKLTLSASNGGNFILGQKEAVLLGCSGKISVTSRVDSEDINQDISLLAEVGEDGPYAGFNNVFVGVEESGIHASEDCDGSFEADAENNNYISGRVNGIWTEASEGEGPTINISAVNDNIIGFEETVANDAGIEFKGEIGEKGINVNSGSVTLTAGNENKISATKYGVYANGENTKVKFDAQANAFNILGAETGASGIFVSDGAEKTIISQDETTFNVTANNGDVNGIYSQNSYIDIDTDTLNMNISLNGGMNDDNVIGISADSIKLDKDLSVDIDAQNGINLDVNQLGNNTLSYSAIISGIYVKNGGKIDLLSNNNDINIKTLSLNNNVNGIYLYKDSEVILTSKNGSVNINAISANNTTGVSLNTNSKLTLSAAKDINIWAYSTQNDKAIKSYGIFSDGGTVNIDADNLIIAAIAENSARGIEINTQTSDPNAVNSIDLNQTLGVYAEGEVAKAISISGLSSSTIEADSGIFATAVGNGGNEVYAFSTSGTNSKLLSSEDINLILVNSGNNRYGDGLFAALFSDNQNEILQATTEVSAKNVNILAQGKAVLDSYSSSFGVYNTYYENNIASKGSNTLTIHADENISIYASADNSYSRGVYAEFSTTEFTANNISVSSYSNINNGYGIFAYHYADEWTNIDNATIVSLHSTMTNSVYGSTMGIRAQVTDYAIGDAKTEVTLVADNGNNNIGAGNVDNGGFGTGWAIYNYCGNSESYGSAVSLTAGRSNMISGSIYSEGKKSSITLTADTNYVASYAQGTTLGDLNTEEAFAGKSVVSALYAEQGAKIELNGEVNGIGTYAVNTDINTLERTVWAYNGYADDYSGERIGSEITINGNVQIKTDRYDETPTSLDVAVAAGTGVNLDKKQVSRYIAEGERAKVDINYSNISAGWLTDKNSNDNTSYNIEGDILSAYEGLINIHTDDADAGINIHGNLLAGNNGILNVDLGKNGVLTGRVDDYGDAGYVGDEGHSTEESFSDPAFSSNIYKGGVVNLAMGEGSRWNVTGQSWITRIEASDSAISATSPRIDLITANTDRNTNAHALTVYELKGNAVFNMSLDGNRNVSDMLYIKNAQGEYMVNVKDAVTVADMYANGHTGLRFATLGAGSSANFRAITWDNGVNNVEYEIDTDDYDTSTENTAYNGSELTAGKPGDTTVDTFFSSDGEPGSTTTGSGDENIDTQNLAAKAMTAKAAPENAGIETAAASDTPNTDATNYKLVAVKSSETSDAGKTVINMSRANYANAVYMDTLNKRQGEARF